MEGYSFLVVDQEHRQAFIDAWETAFNRSLSHHVYDWIFDDNNKIYAFVEENKVIAGYCLYPLEAIVDGRYATVLLCNNVFVDPGRQGRNLFVLLGKQALHHAAVNEYGSVAIGIPNRLALPGHKRVGWNVQPPIYFLEKYRPTASRVDGITWLDGRLPELVKDEIEKCSLKASQGRGLSIIKTKKFLTWRFDSKPGVNYRYGLVKEGTSVVAYCVCKYYEQDRVLHFIDIDGYDPASIIRLILSAEALPYEFQRLNVWDTTTFSDQFREVGYNKVDRKDNLIIKMLHSDACGQNDLSKINLVLADNDVY
ncbi:GNAT family N-acetyltransferase [Castellaniella sp.]|uniref:GNAT family N-acetyltransferase n=1 Tax=Castellaniella sp. TaxID=1955812 RepID=UPI003C74736A